MIENFVVVKLLFLLTVPNSKKCMKVIVMIFRRLTMNSS